MNSEYNPRPRAVRWGGLGLAAWLLLTPVPAHAGENAGPVTAPSPAPLAPPETNLTFTDNILISKAQPVLELSDTDTSPRQGFLMELFGGDVIFAAGTAQGVSRMFDFDITDRRFAFWQPVNFFNTVFIDRSPGVALEVRGAQGDTRMVVKEESQVVAGRNLLRLVNNGPATFRFENAASGAAWGFGSIAAQDKFFISRAGSAGLGLTLDAAGNLTVLGSLTQLSDRNAKRDIASVDGGALLQKIAALPLATWSYKADESGARHIGPMAQDFAAAFGLGADETHVAPSDVAGVGLVAVQALKRENDALRATVAELSARLDALEGAASAKP